MKIIDIMKIGKNFILYSRILLFAAILFGLLLAGCSKKGSQNPVPQKMSTTQEDQGDKIPDQLKGIESGIEKIFKILNGPSVEETDEKGEKKDQGKQSSKTGGQESKGETTKQQGGTQQGGTQQGGTQQKQGTKPEEGGQQAQGEQKAPAPQDPWESLAPVINNLHYQWNSYMPEAVKRGANKGVIDNFSKALNSLTNTVISKNKTNTLLAASYLYAYVPDLYYLYRTKTSPEVKRIRHYVRNAMLNAMTANWAQTETDLNSLKSSWSLYKNAISKDQQDNANKLDLSIYEFEKVIKDKNQPLIDIKGRVTLSNIQSLEQALEKQK